MGGSVFFEPCPYRRARRPCPPFLHNHSVYRERQRRCLLGGLAFLPFLVLAIMILRWGL